MTPQSSLRSALQKVIFPIITTNSDKTHTCIGTGFVILANGRDALIVTAAHVVKRIREIDQPYPRHHPTTPEFFLPHIYRHELRKATPRVLYRSENNAGYAALIEAAVEMPKADLALCKISFDKDVPNEIQFDTRFALDTTPVSVGDQVVAIGYSKMESSALANAQEFEFEARWQQRDAFVSAVFPQTGPTGQEHPCFYINGELNPGMSGGPVLSVGGSVPYVRGIVRSDETRAANPAAPDPPSTAIVSMLWPVMLMPERVPEPDGSVSPNRLIDLERLRIIEDRGRASEHIEYTHEENGQIVEAHWE